MSTKLILTKMVDSRFQRIGVLEFNDAGKGKLTVEDKGAAGAAMQAAWAEVSAMPKVRMKWSETDPKDKTGATQILKGRDFSPGDERYPEAVVDYLSRNFGIFGSPAELVG
jgi:hypothetical protein